MHAGEGDLAEVRELMEEIEHLETRQTSARGGVVCSDVVLRLKLHAAHRKKLKDELHAHSSVFLQSEQLSLLEVFNGRVSSWKDAPGPRRASPRRSRSRKAPRTSSTPRVAGFRKREAPDEGVGQGGRPHMR